MLMMNHGKEGVRGFRDGSFVEVGQAPGVLAESNLGPVHNVLFSKPEAFARAISDLKKTRARVTSQQRAKGEGSSVYNLILKGGDGYPPESVILQGGIANMGGGKVVEKYTTRDRALYAFSPEQAKLLLEETLPERLQKIVDAEPHTMIHFSVVLLNPETFEVISRRTVYSQAFKSNPAHYFVGRNGNGKTAEREPSEDELREAAARAEVHFTEKHLPEFISIILEHFRSGRGVEVTVRMAAPKRSKDTEQVDLPVDLRRW